MDFLPRKETAVVFKCLKIFGFFMLLACFSLPALADSDVDQLKEEINQLKKQVEELKEVLEQQQQVGEKQTQRVEKLEQKVEDKEETVISKFKFRPYGFIKLDAAYDDSRTKVGNFALYAESEATHKNDNEFNMTARQTRLGLDILAPKIYDWEAWGRIEIDFYGDGAKHENKGAVLLRHAFVELKKGNFSLLAGQTSDIISPLYPNTINYTVAWSVGNIGYRRPQLRATYTHPFNEENKLISAFGITRTSGTVNEDFDLDLENDGSDSGHPTVQGRLALATKLLTKKATVIGVSGHWGREEFDLKEHPLTTTQRQKKEKSWSLNGDFYVPITDRFEVKAEAFVGYNLDDYFGGILQGVNPTSGSAIKTVGGWLQLKYVQSDKLKYHVGFGIDDPRNSDLNNGMRSRNGVYFGNVVYTLIPPVDIGLEYSYWDTEYKGERSGINNRIQTSVIYKW